MCVCVAVRECVRACAGGEPKAGAVVRRRGERVRTRLAQYEQWRGSKRRKGGKDGRKQTHIVSSIFVL